MERLSFGKRLEEARGGYAAAASVVGAIAAGVLLVGLTLSVGLDPGWLLGGVFGVVVAVVVQRVQLTWFASTIQRAEGAEWMNRLPLSLWILRRPLRAIEQQLGRRQAALDDATTRDQLREVTVEKLEMEIHTLGRALDDSRADVAEILESLDRALAAASSDIVLRTEVPRLRELVRMNVYAQLPNEEMQLGDVLAGAVAAGIWTGRLSVQSTLPAVSAPSPLVEALMTAAVAVAMAATDQVVRVRGVADGAMAVLAFSAGDPAAPSVDAALLRRASVILGGDTTTRGGEMLIVIPSVFRAGIRAVRPRETDWDPEAI